MNIKKSSSKEMQNLKGARGNPYQVIRTGALEKEESVKKPWWHAMLPKPLMLLMRF